MTEGKRFYGKLQEKEQSLVNEDENSLAYGKTIVETVTTMKQWTTSINEPVADIQLLQNATNVYATPNVFSYWGADSNRKIIENVAYLTCLWQDLDSCTTEEAQEALQVSGLPEPTVFINSGGGVHLYWVFSFKLPTSKYLTSWDKTMKAVQARLAESFPDNSPVKVDTAVLEASRYMRLPGSYNYKKGKYERYTEVVSFRPDLSYSFLDDFYNVYVKPYQESSKIIQFPVKKKPAQGNKAKQPGNVHNGYNRQLREDIFHLIELRGGNMTGCRHSLLLYLQLLTESPARIAYANSLFTDPIPAKELEKILDSSYSNFVKRETIFKGLALTAEEEREMKQLTRENVAKFKKEMEANVFHWSDMLDKLIARAKVLYTSNYAKLTERKQKDAAQLLECDPRTLRRYKAQELEDYKKVKTEIFDDVVALATLLVQAGCVAGTEGVGISPTAKTKGKLAELLHEAPKLVQILENNAELEGSRFNITVLETKTVELWHIAA
ncbi:hypothetical protein ACWOEH_05265 [Enterococcus nangangensis]